MSYVYVMQVAPELVKVGRSDAPERRAHQLTRVWGEKVSLVFKFHSGNAPSVERSAQRILASKRLEGEWFSVEPHEAIKAIEVAASVAIPVRHDVEMSLRLGPIHVQALRKWADMEPDNPPLNEMLSRFAYRTLTARKPPGV